jgi:hypothetical protein
MVAPTACNAAPIHLRLALEREVGALFRTKGVRLFTRNGYDFTDRFPKITEAVESLDVSSCVIDGEAVVVNADGLSNQQRSER